MSTEMLKSALALAEERINSKEIDNKELGGLIRSLYVIQHKEAELAGADGSNALPNRYNRMKQVNSAPDALLENPWTDGESKEEQ